MLHVFEQKFPRENKLSQFREKPRSRTLGTVSLFLCLSMPRFKR